VRYFLSGTIIGVVPGITHLTCFVDRAIAAIREPGAGTFAWLAVAICIVVGLAGALRRKLRQRGAPSMSAGAGAHGS